MDILNIETDQLVDLRNCEVIEKETYYLVINKGDTWGNRVLSKLVFKAID